MNQSDRATVMRKEIRIISNYRAVLISKFFIIICLAISSFFVGYYGYAASPIYILLLFLILPPILSFAFRDYSARFDNSFFKYIAKDTPFVLSSLKRKYSYTRVSYMSNSILFFFTLLLIFFWQYSLTSIGNINPIVLYQPNMIISGGILIRFIAIVYYQIKLPFDLSHNKI